MGVQPEKLIGRLSRNAKTTSIRRIVFALNCIITSQTIEVAFS